MIDRTRLTSLRAAEEELFVALHPRSAELSERPTGHCWPASRCRG